ncbi:MAG: lysophospholipid acyltransferase family protein [Melioribacteraceae bacterium]|nr:lysophospholipid acyltransferase family protein [Melioribacteraceae bacterium]MCF8353504.1 lysophospholipid acyltransferase family protein [Melioribacteraceae bacterium]MCF8392633.1 lysophospholipid acyltransferase family protein [Melioribacteraceae bacterium]MCF8418495.1 lysophospholipid acyltransferase family protein [Melioribacteraceae bacterium]
MSLKQINRSLLRRIGLSILPDLTGLLCRSVKIEFTNKKIIDELTKQNQNYVLAFWHGTMLLPWFLHGNKNFAALVSLSKDGELLTKVLERWNYELARGSSNLGGKEALELLLEKGREGFSIAITPDGPTGPRHEMKAGAVVAAKKLQIPLVLMGIGFKDFYKLKSWDLFEIPKFLTSASVVYSDAIWVDQNLSRDEVNNKIADCNQLLIELQKKAENICRS